MVEELVGSLELRNSLPFGAVNEIAKTFGHSSAWVAKVISGKKKGNQLIIECAIKISELNKDTKAKINNILYDYQSVI